VCTSILFRDSYTIFRSSYIFARIVLSNENRERAQSQTRKMGLDGDAGRWEGGGGWVGERDLDADKLGKNSTCFDKIFGGAVLKCDGGWASEKACKTKECAAFIYLSFTHGGNICIYLHIQRVYEYLYIYGGETH